MYYPYLRGKQYELLMLRECTDELGENGFVPIIEPVKKTTSGLSRCLKVLSEKSIQCIVIVNPQNGDFSENNEKLRDFIKAEKNSNIIPAFFVDTNSKLDEVDSFTKEFSDFSELALIHFDFHDSKAIAELVNRNPLIKTNVFFEGTSSRGYRRKFKSEKRVIIDDGFEKRKRNLDHPDDEHFSDLHLEFKEMGFQGFGDFSIVGDNYSESGGPAYTVAIHMTYLDRDEENDMRIKHFKSNPSDSYNDPAGKFYEAVTKLKKDTDSSEDIEKTKACLEFIDFYNRKHFPGLGVVKKVSMKHHLQLMAKCLGD